MALLHKEYSNVYFHRFLLCLLNQDLMAKVSSICQILEVLSRTLQVCLFYFFWIVRSFCGGHKNDSFLMSWFTGSV